MTKILKALTEGTTTAGGFTVPDPLATRMQEFIQANTVTIPDMDQSFKMTADTLRIPRITAGSTVRKGLAENAAITGADMAFGQITLSAVKIAALMTASTELVEDSNQAVASVIQAQFAKDIRIELDAQILKGTGSSEFTGLTGSVASGNKFSAGTLTWEDFNTGNGLILAANHTQEANVIYMNPANKVTLANLTDSSARPIFDQVTFGSPLLREGVIGTIAGGEVKPTTQLTSSMIIGGIKGMMGYYSVRRDLRLNRFYNIDTDDWVYQANMRSAFVAKHNDAFYLMTSVS